MGTTLVSETYTIYLKSYDVAQPARLALAKMLPQWGLSPVLDDAKVVASELVGNASKLGGVFLLRLSKCSDEVLRIEVEDGSSDPPVITNPWADLENENPDDNGGRGLFIVQALSKDWGYYPTDGGKVVWATLKCL